MKSGDLLRAIRNRDSEVVALALSQGVDPDSTERAGYFVGRIALMEAAANQLERGVELLIQADADACAATQQGAGAKAGYTALHAVIDANIVDRSVDEGTRLRIARRLLEAGADPNAPYGGDTTPAYGAASAGYLAILEAMKERGANLHEAPPGCFSILHGAAQGGHLDAARWALEIGVPVDAATDDGFTPLMTAAYRGWPDMVDLLVDRGADVNRQASDGRTPLVNAALFAQDTVTESQHERAEGIVIRLLEAGADPTIGSFRGNDALEIASRSQNPQAAASIRNVANRTK